MTTIKSSLFAEKVSQDVERLLQTLMVADLIEEFEFSLTPVNENYEIRLKSEHFFRKLRQSIQEVVASLKDISVTKVANAKKGAKNQCKTCRKQFASKLLLENHIQCLHKARSKPNEDRVAHDATNLFCCQSCYSCSKNLDDFKRHSCTTSTPASYFQSASLLHHHNRFKCHYCDQDFRQFKRIEYHLKTCEGSPVSCEICNCKFHSKKLLNEHKYAAHASLKPFRCHECSKMFKLNSSLQKHIVNTHESVSQESLECKFCGKRFLKKWYLTIHLTKYHDLFKPFLCQICGERFVSSKGLSSHMDIHEGLKPFKCRFCEKSFRRKDKLGYHEAIHSGNRPYTCSLCQKTFIRKSKLKEHLNRHTGQKRFTCMTCNKNYSASYDLRQHIIRHHPNIGKNIKPNHPLPPMIIDNKSRKMVSNKTQEPDYPHYEVCIDDIRFANVALEQFHCTTNISQIQSK